MDRKRFLDHSSPCLRYLQILDGSVYYLSKMYSLNMLWSHRLVEDLGPDAC